MNKPPRMQSQISFKWIINLFSLDDMVGIVFQVCIAYFKLYAMGKGGWGGQGWLGVAPILVPAQS